ncbi:SPOR domain-containing protein [Primorskyibacter sp. S87]|uniref:SPOR domain-containing protein n=1 Tax=Primorskyibacter sp. S87 TaxID=3415126 RepID=UPI003C7DD05A
MASFDYPGQVSPQQVQYGYQSPQGAYHQGYDQAETAEYSDEGDMPYGPREISGFGKAANVAGAVASLALLVGLGVWGYQLLMRDVSGVPVVRAVEGPMRVQPEKPGGQPADHQGLAVNSVAANGTAAAPADTLKLAPKPVSLTEEDTVGPSVTDQAVQAVLAETEKPKLEPAVSAEAVEAYQEGSVVELVEALTDGVAPMEAAAANTEQSAEIVQPAPVQPGLAEKNQELAVDPELALAPGVKRSLRPIERPARAVPATVNNEDVEAALRSAVDASASLDLDPDSLPAGTRLAQLGAYDTPEIAQQEWDRLIVRFDDYMDGKQRVIQQASSGGRTFYRLRAAGFDDLSDARRFCSALVAERADCIPVTTR